MINKLVLRKGNRFYKVWRDDFLVSERNGYDHDILCTNMTVDDTPQKKEETEIN